MSGFIRWANLAMTSDQVAAQGIHFSIGFSAVVLTAWIDPGWGPLFAATAIVFALTALKEFVWDTNASYGEGDSWADSWCDFAFYVVGASAGLLLASSLAALGVVPWPISVNPG